MQLSDFMIVGHRPKPKTCINANATIGLELQLMKEKKKKKKGSLNLNYTCREAPYKPVTSIISTHASLYNWFQLRGSFFYYLSSISPKDYILSRGEMYVCSSGIIVA